MTQEEARERAQYFIIKAWEMQREWFKEHFDVDIGDYTH